VPLVGTIIEVNALGAAATPGMILVSRAGTSEALV
jgi:hypothetical protein